jgi:hypothetical protein
MCDLPLNKIKKLLALTESPNASEASVAMAKVHQLLKEYNLTLSDIVKDNRFSIIENDYLSFQKERKWRTILIYDVATANYCTCLRFKYGDGNNSLKIVGKEHNILATRIMLDYLIETIEKRSKNFEACLRKDYQMGFVSALAKRFQKIKEEDQIDCTALVVQEKSAIDQYLKERGDVTSVSVKVKVDKNSIFNSGYNDGSNVSLNNQVSSSYSEKVRVS